MQLIKTNSVYSKWAQVLEAQLDTLSTAFRSKASSLSMCLLTFQLPSLPQPRGNLRRLKACHTTFLTLRSHPSQSMKEHSTALSRPTAFTQQRISIELSFLSAKCFV